MPFIEGYQYKARHPITWMAYQHYCALHTMDKLAIDQIQFRQQEYDHTHVLEPTNVSISSTKF